jgi:bacterioferritin
MQGNKKLIITLNTLLADELSAINQYVVHAEMCENWGYPQLHNHLSHVAHEEMHHAHWLIGRIIFLDGVPIVSKLNPMKIGKNVSEIIHNDQSDELEAVHAYNTAIRQAREVGDEATLDLLTKILKMEEGHVDWEEQQRDQIQQMGLANYLANQALAPAV